MIDGWVVVYKYVNARRRNGILVVNVILALDRVIYLRLEGRAGKKGYLIHIHHH